MSDAAIVSIVTGVVTIVTLWLKLQSSADAVKETASKAATRADDAAVKAEIVEKKLDANTATTEQVNDKTDTIVSQTNGTMDAIRRLVETLAERVEKLEGYNRDSTHRIGDAIQAMHLKLAELVALQPKPAAIVKPMVESPEKP